MTPICILKGPVLFQTMYQHTLLSCVSVWLLLSATSMCNSAIISFMAHSKGKQSLNLSGNHSTK